MQEFVWKWSMAVEQFLTSHTSTTLNSDDWGQSCEPSRNGHSIKEGDKNDFFELNESYLGHELFRCNILNGDCEFFLVFNKFVVLFRRFQRRKLDFLTIKYFQSNFNLQINNTVWKSLKYSFVREHFEVPCCMQLRADIWLDQTGAVGLTGLGLMIGLIS